MRRLLLSCVLAAATLTQSGGFDTQSAQKTVPVPTLQKERVEMRVVHVVNSRLPRMSEDQLQTLLASLRETVKQNFGVHLVFTKIDEASIESTFAPIPSKRLDWARANRFDFKSGKADPEKLRKAFASEFAKSKESLSSQIQFARPHVPGLRDDFSVEQFGSRMADVQLQRLARWSQVKGLDGNPVIDATDHNEYLAWLVLGYTDLPYELVITNQIIAGAEFLGTAVHSALRGGYTNGITTYSKASRYGTAAIWSTFAFTGNDDFSVQMRDGETYDASEAARLAGTAAAHEIGHQLFHLLHPFARPECIMNPVPMFTYRAWANKLSPSDCRLESDPAMTPGASTFNY
jgi:hypothetical protein